MKALTFSFDDGVTQDKRLAELFRKYKMGATFNVNSALLGKEGRLNYDFGSVDHNKISPDETGEVYRGFEVAVHTLTHPLLDNLSEEDIIREVEEDRKALSSLSGQIVLGMAYPCRGPAGALRKTEKHAA